MIFGFETPQAVYKWQKGIALPTVDNLVERKWRAVEKACSGIWMYRAGLTSILPVMR